MLIAQRVLYPIVGNGSGIAFCPVQSRSCKSAHLFLVSENVVTLDCVEKAFTWFHSLLGHLTPACRFFFLNQLVKDLAWEASHTILYNSITSYVLSA